MKIVVTQFMSLDGVVQAPGGPDEDTDGGFAHGGWSVPHFDPELMGGAWAAAVEESTALLFGRRTWEVSAKAWPAQAGDPFADRINILPKYVASRILSDADVAHWSSSQVLDASDAVGAVRALREDGGAGQGEGLLELVSVITAATGVLVTTYRRVR